MRKSTHFPYFVLLFFLVGLTIALSIAAFSPFSASAKLTILPRVAIGSPLEVLTANNSLSRNRSRAIAPLGCHYSDIECWQEEISQIDREIAYYREQENWQAVAQLQRRTAEIYNRLSEFPHAIALLCGASARGGDRQTLPTCEADSAIDYAQRAKDALGELAIWGILADSYRFNSHYDRAVLVVEKFANYRTICPTETGKCSAKIESMLWEIAGKVYADRAQRHQQRARSARERGGTTDPPIFRQKANDDRNLALEKLTTSRQLAETDEDRARIDLEILRVYENQVQALLAASALKNSEDELSEIETVFTHRQVIIVELQTLYPQLSSRYLQFRLALSLAGLEVRHPAQLMEEFAANSSVFSSPFCQPRLLGEERSRQLLEQALNIAEELENSGLKSFAFGELGHLEECANHLSLAQKYTQKAREESQSFPAIQYLWHWQAGRIWLRDENREGALYAYGKAIETLQEEELRPGRLVDRIRQYPRDWQFDFRDRVAPLYRQYVRLLLETAETLPRESDLRRQLFNDAGNAIEALQLVEFEDYFEEECRPARSREEMMDELLDEKTAILRFIVLGKKTALIAQRRSPLPAELVWVDTQTLKAAVQEFRKEINRPDVLLAPAQQIAKNLYTIMLAPLIETWQPEDVETLVFIPDDVFNNIPMAALYDGEKYLVENYAIATLPGLSFTQPKTRNSRKLWILGFGLSEVSVIGKDDWPALKDVEQELLVIDALPGTQTFLNEQFNRDALEQAIEQNYQILHFATHASFGTVADDTFLVMGAKNTATRENDKLTLHELETLLDTRENRLELLVLSACETGKGDNRLTLGLGGIALRSGIPSILASLWAVDDAATANLMSDFYRYLSAKDGVAQALQKAQIDQIEKRRHLSEEERMPYFWAAFIAIGNWL